MPNTAQYLRRARLGAICALLLCALAFPVCAVQAPQGSTLCVGAGHYTRVDVLATALGAQVAYPQPGSLRLTRGGETLDMAARSPLAVHNSMPVALPALPVVWGNALFVPTQSVSELLGGAFRWPGARSSVTWNGQVTDLPPCATLPEDGTGVGGVQRILNDPRISAEESAASWDNAFNMGQVRPVLDAFMPVADTLHPVLVRIADTLKRVEWMPGVGGSIKQVRETTEILTAVIDISRKVRDLDEQYRAPVSAAFAAALRVKQNPTVENIRASRAAWKAAGPALAAQQDLYDKLHGSANGLIQFTALMENGYAALERLSGGDQMIATGRESLVEARQHAQQIVIAGNALTYQVTFNREYFARLLAASEGL